MTEKILLDAGPSERGWHRIETAMRCKQLYAFKYILDVKFGSTSEPLIKGSLVHVGLAHYYMQIREEEAGRDPNIYYDPLEAMRILAERNGKAWIAFLPVTTEAVRAYTAFYQNDTFKVIEVEQQHKANIGKRGWLFTQRFDLVIQDRLGRYWIVDHKTCYQLSAKTTARYRLSGQFLGMRTFGHAEWGDKFGGVLLNLICLTAPFRFARPMLAPAPEALALFPYIIEDAETEVERLAADGRDPWNYPRALSEQVCFTAYGPCPAEDLCAWGPEYLSAVG